MTEDNDSLLVLVKVILSLRVSTSITSVLFVVVCSVSVVTIVFGLVGLVEIVKVLSVLIVSLFTTSDVSGSVLTLSCTLGSVDSVVVVSVPPPPTALLPVLLL